MMLPETGTDLLSKSALSEFGFAIIPAGLAPDVAEILRATIFKVGRVSARCLLDRLIVRSVAIALGHQLSAAGLLGENAVAIQAIAFDKSPTANWKVGWHQDTMFPLAARPTAPGFELPSIKEGVDYARPRREILEDLLAVRLHLDDCDEANGPLRVAPGSHRHGILRSTEIPDCVARHGEMRCLAQAGDALLMKPLLLHASSPATAPRHRRVLHLVYYSGDPIAEKWHRSV